MTVGGSVTGDRIVGVSLGADSVNLNDLVVGGSVTFENVSRSDRVAGNSVSADKD